MIVHGIKIKNITFTQLEVYYFCQSLHIIFNALNAQSMGISNARELADLHEMDNNSTPNMHLMDYHNNEIGFGIAGSNDLVNSAFNAINLGQAQRLSDPNTQSSTIVKTDGTGRCY